MSETISKLLQHKRLNVSLGVSALVLAGGAVGYKLNNHPQAKYRAFGEVSCAPVQGPVEGVWIATGSKSDSGFATLGSSTETKDGNTATYTRMIDATSYFVHVGCGGDPSSWTTQDYGTEPLPADTSSISTCTIPDSSPGNNASLPQHHGTCNSH